LSADPQADPPAKWTSRHALRIAEDDGTLRAAASTWSAENKVLVDGTSRPGVRVVTFAPVLKHGVFPLAEILRRLLQVSAAGTSSPVELEFAVNLSVPHGEPAEFGFLQMRPLARLSESTTIEIGDAEPAQLLCRSNTVLGHGHISDIRDLIVVDPDVFERRSSHDVAQQLTRLNATLQQAGIPYVLIGVGRWGSADPLLGIPVAWSQIAGARVIVEAGFRDFVVEPSQGTHFFQNLYSCNVGYFTVNPQVGQGFVDWDWLAAQPRVASSGVVHHLRLAQPVVVKMNGRGQGIILKPADGAATADPEASPRART
jgi:hypothetical protein